MTFGHIDPLYDWGREPCGSLELPTSFCAHREGPRTRGHRTRSGPGAASMGSTAAVHNPWQSGVVMSRLPRSKDYDRKTSSAASSPKEVGVGTDLGIGNHVRAFDLPYLPDGFGHPRSDQVPFGAGLKMGLGAMGLLARGVARALRHFTAGRGFGRVVTGAFGTDEGRASGDPIRASF